MCCGVPNLRHPSHRRRAVETVLARAVLLAALLVADSAVGTRPAEFTPALAALVHADAVAKALLALAPPALVGAYAASEALLALAPLALVDADAAAEADETKEKGRGRGERGRKRTEWKRRRKGE